MIEQPLEKELWQTYDSIVGIDEAGRILASGHR